eukprot:symbB.v1.2.027212.t1/scaffold2706.1/size72654/2
MDLEVDLNMPLYVDFWGHTVIPPNKFDVWKPRVGTNLATLCTFFCKATRVAHVEEENGQQFRAPVVSLQKDIQRHYAQRLQDLQTRGGLRSVPKTCSFEVNFAQGGAERGTGSPPPRMEAWRSP